MISQLIQRLTGVFAFTLLISTSLTAQETEAQKAEAYSKVVKARAEKIVTTLKIEDAKKATKVRDIIAGQYIDLNAIHDARNAAIKSLKSQNKAKDALDAEVKLLEEAANDRLAKLHKKYLKALSKELTDRQIEQVKDGMTYGVLPITYRGYQEMLPQLTEVQKKQILAYLTEAREFAMDAESSEKKHGWFGKYKGRINNYLSAAGINMKQASIEWQARIKAEEEAKKSQ
jgi:hypothetical protein